MSVVNEGGSPLELPRVTKTAWKVLIATSLTNFAVGLDMSMTNVAIPDIQRSFPSASTADLSWAITFYMVAYAGFLIVSGRWADRFGRLRVLNIGFGCFVLGSALLTLMPTVSTLVAARGLIGIGAAMAAPASLGLAVAAWPAERRGTAVAIWSSTLALSSAIGPIIGGFAIELGSWRWAFALNVPIGILALVWGARVLTESSRDPNASRPDLTGSFLITAATAGLALVIVQGGEWGWLSLTVLGLLASIIVAGTLLIRRIATHPDPILPKALLTIRSFRVANITIFLFGLGFFSAMLTMVLYLTEIAGYSTVKTGFGVSVLATAAFVTSNVAGRLADRFGYRRVAMPGMCLFVFGCLWLTQRAGQDPTFFVDVFPGFVLLGLGIGSGPPILAAAAVSDVNPENFSVAGAIVQTARQLSGAIGVSVVVTILGNAPSETSFRSAFLYLGMVTGLAVVMASRLPSLQNHKD